MNSLTWMSGSRQSLVERDGRANSATDDQATRTLKLYLVLRRSNGVPSHFLQLLKLWRPSVYGAGALVALWCVSRWLEPDYGPRVHTPEGVWRIERGMSMDEVCALCGGPPGRHASDPCVRPYYLCLGDAPPASIEWVWDTGAVAVKFDKKDRVRSVIYPATMRRR